VRGGTSGTDNGLVLWNTLGGNSELRKSRVGPSLIPLQRLKYASARFGSGILSDNDDYVARVPKGILNAEQGTICLWVKLVSVPSSFPNATRHFFVGPIEFSANDGQAHSGWVANYYGHRLYSINRFGTTSTASLGRNGEEIFLSIRWNRNGVPGHGSEKVVLFRNGKKIGTYWEERSAKWPDELGNLILNKARYNPTYASGTVNLDLIYDDIKIYNVSIRDKDIMDLYSR